MKKQNKMNEDQIKQLLRLIKPSPSDTWQKLTLSEIKTSVTTNQIKRNSLRDIYNLIKLPYMSKKFKIIISIVSVLVILGAGTGTSYASNSAVPGDFLYGLDKLTESVQRSFISDPIKETEFEMKVMDERISELEKLSIENNSELISKSISEIESQQIRLQEMVQSLNQYRIENKIQVQEQQQLLERIQTQEQSHEEIMTQIQIKLQSKDDKENIENLEKVQNQYSEETQNQIQNFENDTGKEIQESETEQNKNDGTQYNQEQEQNQNSDNNDDINDNFDNNDTRGGN